VDSDCPGAQHCAKQDDYADGCEGGDCYCAYSDDGSTKYVITHELGHNIRSGMLGGTNTEGDYYFTCPGGNCSPGNEDVYGRISSKSSTSTIDPPYMDPVYGCRHVKASNAEHGLQSIERVSQAHAEGFGHFFSTFIWNSPSRPSCRFNYYKEFLDVGADSCRVRNSNGTPNMLACSSYVIDANTTATVTAPPITFDCNAGVKWRNTQRCGVDSSAEVLQKNTMGTELDWMTFLYAVTKQVGFGELMDLHKAACRRNDITQKCVIELPAPPGQSNFDFGDPMSWTDGLIGGTIDPVTGTLLGAVEHGGFLSGAQRKYPVGDPKIAAIGDLGLSHGVSEDTAQ
jgi:hypothetical protein